jgi:Ion channel
VRCSSSPRSRREAGAIPQRVRRAFHGNPVHLVGERPYLRFTLGYGDIVPHTAAARTVSVIEAGCGIGFIAVVIGYLPVLYQLFSRREAHVIQLDARAGSPPTATTMLSRHAEADSLDKLDDLLREWEVWGSDLLESHLSYPMLVFYRSQHDNQSWLAALSAVMDSCALILVGVEEMKPLQARMTFAMARQVVVEMARSFQIKPSRYDGGDRLPPADYLRMEGILAKAGLQLKGGPETQEILAGLRATYEPQPVYN